MKVDKPRKARVLLFLKKVRKTRGCWLWTASTTGPGYGQFWSGEKRIDAHRFSYIVHKGEIPKNMVVMHKCDNKLCVKPDHLEIGTQKDNLRDMYAKGRNRNKKTYAQQSGENHWMHKRGLVRA